MFNLLQDFYDGKLYSSISVNCRVTLSMENRITTGDSYRFSAFLVSYNCLRISNLRITLVESMSKPLRKSGRSCAPLSPCNGVQYVNSGDLVLDFRTRI